MLTTMLQLPVALLGLMEPSHSWATTLATYPTATECMADIDAKEADYQTQWPEAVIWCAAPLERSLAPSTSIIPKPRPVKEIEQ